MLTFPLGADDGQVLTKGDLDRAANPQLLNQLEAIPQPLYDTQDLANADTGPFQFFVQTQNDQSLSNLASPGQLAADNYFVLQYICLTWLQAPVTKDDTGVQSNLADISNFFVTNLPTVSLFVSKKEYGPWPALMAGADGGISAALAGEGATAAGRFQAVVQNGIPGTNGLFYGGSVVLTPRKQFSVVVSIKAGGALTLVNPAKLRVTLMGTEYRNVQ